MIFRKYDFMNYGSAVASPGPLAKLNLFACFHGLSSGSGGHNKNKQ
jgi:hypothetical protein